MVTYDQIVHYIILGALIGVIWSLKRIYVLENKIVSLESKANMILNHIEKKKR